jgi:hypothetical protein
MPALRRFVAPSPRSSQFRPAATLFSDVVTAMTGETAVGRSALEPQAAQNEKA